MDLHAELERVMADSAVADTAARAIRKLIEDAQRSATEQITRRTIELHAAQTKIQALTLELAHLRRMRFGVKSEALDAETRDLFQETLASDVAAAEAELAKRQAEAEETPVTPRPKRARAGRQTLPEHLPRIEHHHEPESCTCGQCGQDLVKIGEDISEQLDVEPAKFFVHRHIRPQYACRACETVSAAPIPPAVIDGGMAAVGLLAWVIIGKYLDHLPLYRLERIAARDGVTLSRSTLAEWVGRIGVALQPLADRLTACLLERQILHADETPVQQLDPGNGKTKRAYLWAYMSNVLETGPPIVVFDYQTSRSGAHARNFLGEWKGALMVDDFGGYKALFGQEVTELGCFAHARRKYFDLNAAQAHPIAQEALLRIAALYAIEARGREMSIAERTTLRQREALPLLVSMHEWLSATRMTVANGGGTAKAIDYSLKRWPALSRYAMSGALPIDNNPVENAIRPICLGKKNWLFTGSERAGQRAAAIQSLLATATLNGLDPAAWLRGTLEKLPTCLNSEIDSLLPLRQTA
ncbi:IS66 family transposase [Sulfuritalea hydrogenivorans]|uniref:Transposase n=1 Tax=Sulfuritalea hydrogenivorans sk43H TaxID=1223802 RepID=W0SGF6_9PROT|nr:IS66 family transposase [Sulfuritalea hydrogenivorans]BAO30027.1 transposase [Sulfuritalea hydrogenivorans sk43H]